MRRSGDVYLLGVALAAAVALPCSAGCSTTSDGSPDAPDASAGAPGPVTLSTTLASNGHSGTVALGQLENTGTYTLDVDAWFFDTTDAGEAIQSAPTAGEIDVVGEHLPGGALHLFPTPTSIAGTDQVSPSPYFVGGDTLTVSGAGSSSSVGPFSAQLAAPGDIALVSPAPGAPLVIARSQDLVLRWTGGTPGTLVHVNISAGAPAAPTPNGVSLDYYFDAAPGAGAIPSTGGLATLPHVDGVGTTGGMSWGSVSKATVSAGNAGGSASAADAWTIDVTATGNPLSALFTTD